MSKLGMLGTLIQANQHAAFTPEHGQDKHAQNVADFLNDIVTLILVAVSWQQFLIIRIVYLILNLIFSGELFDAVVRR